MAKTNWQLGDTVQPADLNQIGQEINDNTTDVQNVTTELTTHVADSTSHVHYAVATGSANNYAVTLNPVPSAYLEGMALSVKINVTNTGTSNINVNGMGNKPIRKSNGSNVSAGNLRAGSIYTLRYDGSAFILQGEGGSGNAQPNEVLENRTFTNDEGEQVGTMPNRTGNVIGQSISRAATALRIKPQVGYYDENSNVQFSDPNWVARNIRQGISIFGLAGSMVERRYAEGTTTTTSTGNFGVTGLAFRPTVIIASVQSSTGIYYTRLWNENHPYNYQLNRNMFWNFGGVEQANFTVDDNGFNVGFTYASVNNNRPAQWWAFE